MAFARMSLRPGIVHYSNSAGQFGEEGRRHAAVLVQRRSRKTRRESGIGQRGGAETAGCHGVRKVRSAVGRF